jgi:hypothetical protein
MIMAELEQNVWVGHRVLARLVRVLGFVIPFGTSVAAAFLVASWLPAPPEFLSELLRLIVIVGASTVVIIGTDRVTRRLFPLSALLGLTLTLPVATPSRSTIASRTGSADQLRARLDDAARGEAADASPERLLDLVAMLSVHGRFARGHAARVRASTELVEDEAGSPNPNPADWGRALNKVAVLNAGVADPDRSGKRSGAVVAAGALAGVLGIAASPTSAVAFESIAFGAPIPFVGGDPFTDDADESTVAFGRPDTDGASPSPGPGGLPEVPRLSVAGEGLVIGSDTTTETSSTVVTAPDTAPDTVVDTVVDTRPPSTVDETGNTTTTRPPKTTTTEATTTSTVAPSTTTTTVPPTTTSTSSTTSTTSTTTTTTTTTTEPPVGELPPAAYLIGPSTENTTSKPVLPLGVGNLPDVELPNYDTDHDDLPGIVIEPSGEHLYADDPDAVQRFRMPVGSDTLIDGEVHATLWVAAGDFREKSVGVIVALYDCEGESCTKLTWGDEWFVGGDGFEELTIQLGWAERIVPAGHELEFRVAVSADSEGDLLLAFGTEHFASNVFLEGSGCSAKTGTGC